LLGASLRSLDRDGSDTLGAPWPDLVISTGRRTAPVARWIGEQSRGAARLVQLGRKGGEPAEQFDLVVSCEHFRQPWHSHRLQTLLPLNRVGARQLEAAAERWAGLFGDAPKPHIALVVGGSSALHRLDPGTARRLGAEVASFAESLGGRLMAITSPRTGEAAARALEQGLGSRHNLHRWRPGEADNPYLGYLALADVLVVTGESESMLSEAVASGKPLLIYPLPERRRGPRDLLAEAVVRRAHTPRLNKRGTVRPQRGLQYRCARLVDLGLVRPRRDLSLLHRALVERGLARLFGQPLPEAPARPYQEAPQVAARVRALMGRDE
jgi:mitochondrial fission protein ELM1